VCDQNELQKGKFASARRQAAVASGFTVTVYNPSYWTRVLAVHANFSARDAAGLVAIYLALGYSYTFIRVTQVRAMAA
jgi:threonine/homoserine/homoserine lactone efflux protein